MEPYDYDTDSLNFGLQKTSAFHFLWFWKTDIYLINWYMTFIIYRREPSTESQNSLSQHHSVPAKGCLCPDGFSAKLSDGKRDELVFMFHFVDRNLRQKKVLPKTT